MKKPLIESFSSQQKAEIMDYAANHSSRETSAFVQKQYGIKISYVTITKLMDKHYEELPYEVKQVKHMSIGDITHVRTYLRGIFDSYIKESHNPDNPRPVQLSYQSAAVDLGLKIAKMATEVLKTPLAIASETTQVTQEQNTLGWVNDIKKDDEEPEEETPVVEGTVAE